MLVLSRKRQESVMIGPDVSVTVVGFREGTVRLGIEAPKHLRIRRDELFGVPTPEGKVHVRFKFFVGLEDHTWFEAEEFGSGCDIQSAGRHAAQKIVDRMKHLPIAFVHFGQPEAVTHVGAEPAGELSRT